MTFKQLFPLINTTFIATLLLATGCDLDSSSSTAAASTTTDAATPAASSSGVGNDIPVSSVVWLDADVSGWAQTATLNASISGGTLNLNYNQASQWPAASLEAKDGGSLNANPWVIVDVNGTYYGATFEWLRTGQTSKPTSVVTGAGGHIVQPPLNTFRPVSGEKYGFMVTTPARGGFRTINERSNISVVTWP